MNRANQGALFQQTNVAVVGIRQLEISYYTNVYSVFGTQAILILGFVYSTFSQNNTQSQTPHELVYLYLYYISTSMTFASALHVTLSSMLMQVYGPGLALNGPLGSMVRAAEGLRSEQDQIITSFTIMILSFASCTIWSFWTVMNFPQAVACTFVFLAAARQWYFYTQRIYLRFYWNKEESNWNSGRPQDELEFDQEPGVKLPEGNAENSVPAPHYKKKELNFPFRFGKNKSATALNSEESPASQSHMGTAISGDTRGVDLSASSTKGLVAMEGYFTCRGQSEQQVIHEAKRWERQYFVLFRTGEFYVYKTRQNYRTDPRSPLFLRPLRLADFHVNVDNTDKEMRAEFEDDGRSVVSAALTVRADHRAGKRPSVLLFQITLVPRENEEYERGEGQGQQQGQVRNRWLLRCDTEEELQIWLAIIQEVCPSCFLK